MIVCNQSFLAELNALVGQREKCLHRDLTSSEGDALIEKRRFSC